MISEQGQIKADLCSIGWGESHKTMPVDVELKTINETMSERDSLLQG